VRIILIAVTVAAGLVSLAPILTAAAACASSVEPAVRVVICLPGSQFVVEPGVPVAIRGSHGDELIRSLAQWLSQEFDLPAMHDAPAVRFTSPKRMASLRVRDTLSDRMVGSQTDVLAIYDDGARTIYLPDDWTGSTPAELSVLIHELVHHIQNEADSKFACPQEREQAAYEAQERWLKLFGHDLETDFELDGFTLLVRTNCPL
jgi:hypothetical protein